MLAKAYKYIEDSIQLVFETLILLGVIRLKFESRLIKGLDIHWELDSVKALVVNMDNYTCDPGEKWMVFLKKGWVKNSSHLL